MITNVAPLELQPRPPDLLIDGQLVELAIFVGAAEELSRLDENLRLGVTPKPMLRQLPVQSLLPLGEAHPLLSSKIESAQRCSEQECLLAPLGSEPAAC
jgi:hypothetical protein